MALLTLLLMSGIGYSIVLGLICLKFYLWNPRNKSYAFSRSVLLMPSFIIWRACTRTSACWFNWHRLQCIDSCTCTSYCK